MIYDKRNVFAIVHKEAETVAGIRASGSLVIVPALFANKDAAVHHMLHAPHMAEEYKIESINIIMDSLEKKEKAVKKKTIKPKNKKHAKRK